MDPYVTTLPLYKAHIWKNNKLTLGQLDIELTERCNNNCSHCYINLPADDVIAEEKELSTTDIKNILKEAASLGCLRVRFTGGEPLLRKDFEELYVFTRKLGFKVFLFTNATLVTPYLTKLFKHIPLLGEIVVTVYGMKKDSYEAVTNTSGSFEAAWQGINLLLKNKIPFVVKGALLPANKNEVSEFEEWAKSIPWMNQQLPSYSMFFDLRCRRDIAKNEVIQKLRISPEEGLKFLSRKEDKYMKEMKEFCSKFMRPSEDKLFSCGSGHGGCIDAYGKFQPCMMLRYPDCVYDLLSEDRSQRSEGRSQRSLRDALENFFPKMREMKATNPDYLVRCAKCFLKGLCEQCPAKSWMEHGTLDTPVEYLCEIAHAQARFLGLIGENEKAWEVVGWRSRIERFVGVQKSENRDQKSNVGS